jgi:hypothetical protein
MRLAMTFMRLAIRSEGHNAAPAPNTPVVPSVAALPFVKDAVVHKVADEKESSRTGKTYEIADAIWHLVQAGVHIILPALSLREPRVYEN